MEFESIKQALELTGTAGAAVKSIGNATDTIRGWVKGKGNDVPQEVREVIADLASRVADAKLANAELAIKLAEFQTNAIREDAFLNEKARYKLHETSLGVIVWALVAEKANGEPMRFACPLCMESGSISFLPNKGHYRMCKKCNSGFDFEEAPPLSSSGYSDGW